MRKSMTVGRDGRTAVIEVSTGIEVRLYPVDAREAVLVGSHAWPKGMDPMIEADEIQRLTRELEELRASRAEQPPKHPVAHEQAASAPASRSSRPADSVVVSGAAKP